MKKTVAKPRLLIAAPKSGSGKTVVTLLLLQAFKKAGLKVQAFKAGPDYIDPCWHKLVLNRPSINLDTWLTNQQAVKDCFLRYSQQADIAVIEGVMGLFDGKGIGLRGSSAELAVILQTPVILVVDASGSARSLAAVIQGFKQHHRLVKVAGVFLNKVGSERHLRLCTEVISRFCQLPVVGYLQKKAEFMLSSQHLGLVAPHLIRESHSNRSFKSGGDSPCILQHQSDGCAASFLNSLAQVDTVDLNVLLAIAKQAPSLTFSVSTKKQAQMAKIKIAVGYDEAFFFAYEDNFKFWEELGAELLFFSPLKSKTLPRSIQGLYLPGGYPELFAAQVAENKLLLKEIKEAVDSGLPTYAECGGMLYLTRKFQIDGTSYPLAGAIPYDAFFTNQRQALGYVRAKTVQETVLGPKNSYVRGHRFHWSYVNWQTENAAFLINNEPEGYAAKNLLASFVHLNFRGFPEGAVAFLQKCQGGC